ncbi:MAG: hypothetical protein Q8P33_02470 [bacterium]|nr:hypothetical protein [bacterium]
MRTIILFRFHKKPNVCRNRLKLLRQLNPAVPIYALYGGTKADEKAMQKATGRYFEKWYRIPTSSSKWKWLHSDLAARGWFKKVGKKVAFDRLHIIEWDLLTLAPLQKLYGALDNKTIALSGLVPLKQVQHRWYWTTKEPYKSQWRELLTWARQNHNYQDKPFSSVGPGASLPRGFFERYAAVKVPELVHDELRLPLFAQLFGLKLKDTGFFKRSTVAKPNRAEHFYFNCHNHLVSLTTIKRELAKARGRRVFHPYRAVLPDTVFKSLS